MNAPALIALAICFGSAAVGFSAQIRLHMDMREFVPITLRDGISMLFAVHEFIFSRNVPAKTRALYLRELLAISICILSMSAVLLAIGRAVPSLLMGAVGLYALGNTCCSYRRNARL